MQPEDTVSSKPIYDGKIVRLRVDQVRLASGVEATREVVEHDESVVVVPMDVGDNVLLVRQYRYPIGKAILEAPAGVVKDSEPPDDSARRELQEETGYTAGELIPMGGFWSSPGFCTEYIHAYLARDLEPGDSMPEDDEDITVERVPLGWMYDMIENGDIRDAKTIAAFLMAAHVFDSR